MIGPGVGGRRGGFGTGIWRRRFQRRRRRFQRKAGALWRRRRFGAVVTMNIKRIVRHLLATDWQVNRAFPRQALIAIEKAIKASEAAHAGEIRFRFIF